MVKIIPYNPKLKELARKLRKDMTFGEVILWDELKNNKFHGFDFDRQRCIDNYIVDFFSKELLLVIEIDGRYHYNEEALMKDDKRQLKLEVLGVQFLRFSETELKNDLFNVLRTIETKIIEMIKNDSSIDLPKEFDRTLLE